MCIYCMGDALGQVGILYLRYTDGRKKKGLVTFEVAYETYYINGVTGALVPPHMEKGWMKLDNVICMNMMHARAHVPRTHPLCRLGGWHTLPASMFELAAPIGTAAEAL